jgi:hypothetical protein
MRPEWIELCKEGSVKRNTGLPVLWKLPGYAWFFTGAGNVAERIADTALPTICAG